MISIGLIGRKQSGKDSVARTLVSNFGYRRLAFADALKDMALRTDPYVMTGIRRRLTDVVSEAGWEAAKETWPDVRRLLQRLGVAAREVIGPDVWVDKVRAQLAHIPGPVVVTDVRFPNEAAFLRRAGFALARIERPGLSTLDSHPSEVNTDRIPTDWQISNDSTLDVLAQRVRSFAQEVLSHA